MRLALFFFSLILFSEKINATSDLWLDLSYSRLSSPQMSECSKEMNEESPEEYPDPFVSVEEVIPFVEGLKSSPSFVNVRAISISGNVLKDREAGKVISIFSDAINLHYMDVSDNALSIESVAFFMPFLRNEAFSYLDITGNEKIANKNIICFYRELCRHADAAEACYLMKKIIFIKKSYLRAASTTTIVYREFQREFLSDDWDECHKRYYKAVLVKEMKSKYSIYTDTGINRRNYEILTNGSTGRASELIHNELQGLIESTEDLSI
jgi:hypothetical protein